MQFPAVSPGRHSGRAALRRCLQPMIILRANGVGGAAELGGMCCAQGEQVNHPQAAKSPLTGKSQAAPQGWIVLDGVGGGWI